MRAGHSQQANTTLTDDEILDIGVSYDGSWLIRGHTSNVGVACEVLVDLLNGLCIGAHGADSWCFYQAALAHHQTSGSYDKLIHTTLNYKKLHAHLQPVYEQLSVSCSASM